MKHPDLLDEEIEPFSRYLASVSASRIGPDSVEEFQRSYCGRYANAGTFARGWATSTGYLAPDNPLVGCIDWPAFASLILMDSGRFVFLPGPDDTVFAFELEAVEPTCPRCGAAGDWSLPGAPDAPCPACCAFGLEVTA